MINVQKAVWNKDIFGIMYDINYGGTWKMIHDISILHVQTQVWHRINE